MCANMKDYINSRVHKAVTEARKFLNFGVRTLTSAEIDNYLQNEQSEHKKSAVQDYYNNRRRKEKDKEKCLVPFSCFEPEIQT